MELIQQLMQQLGIDENQAKGGVGLIFKMVKDKLSDSDFGQVQENVPEVQGFIDSAPDEDSGGGGLMGMVGGLAKSFGMEKLGGLASLAGGFDKLGIDASKITSFIPIILKFVESQGGGAVKSILENVLGGGDKE